jgi:hypothetical protein
MSTFNIDLIDGKRAEQVIGDIFVAKGYTVVYAPDGYHPDWDLLIGDRTCEVKFDRKAHATGQIFFEIRFHGNPSGAYSTKAEWFFVVTLNYIYMMRTSDLIGFLDRPTYGRSFIRAGDGLESEGWLVPLEQMDKIDINSLKIHPLN